MNRRTLLQTSLGTVLAMDLGKTAGAEAIVDKTQVRFDTMLDFMGTIGKETGEFTRPMCQGSRWQDDLVALARGQFCSQ
jgi:hypothetical protein